MKPRAWQTNQGIQRQGKDHFNIHAILTFELTVAIAQFPELRPKIPAAPDRPVHPDRQKSGEIIGPHSKKTGVLEIAAKRMSCVCKMLLPQRRTLVRTVTCKPRTVRSASNRRLTS
ncbi:MAG: hypothetical protein HY881_17945 [Deltaproteobacteria bacterium]|nr:hypothetical protein [Deltaproteobacteria bacterium]